MPREDRPAPERPHRQQSTPHQPTATSHPPTGTRHRPRHRADAPRPSVRTTLRSRGMSSMTLTGVAVAATGLAVASGVTGSDRVDESSASATGAVTGGRADVAAVATPRSAPRVAPGRIDRAVRVSRSDLRTSVDEVKKATLNQDEGGQVTRTEDLTSRDPRTIARAMLPAFGFSSDQFSCLDSLYVSESGWNVHADNPSSSAYGIPQALPGSKMSSAGADWADNPVTQIRWGLGYIKARYGTPCGAWSFKQGHNWY